MGFLPINGIMVLVIAMKYYKFKPEKSQNCEIRLFVSEQIYEQVDKSALQQLFNARQLPGVKGVVGLPDIHKGYGLPIGGVMVCDSQQGVISPGAVGFDINCGVRLLTSNLEISRVENKITDLIKTLKHDIPAGVGVDSRQKFSQKEFKNIVEQGIPYVVNNLNTGSPRDIENCEENGVIDSADLSKVSSKAIKRGKTQLGTLGSGNHFVEIQKVDQIFARKNKFFSPEQEKYAAFMIHTGSRGFGHQIAKDYTERAKKKNSNYSFSLPAKNLASFPATSKEGKDYLQAMACAANFAFANRQFLTDKLRKAVRKIFPEVELELFYDLTHNIAKYEEHKLKGKTQEFLVHRKGATRLNEGGIALIPGSMGTGSYIVTSMNSESTVLSFKSVAHGAGRTMGRREAKRTISKKQHQESLGKTEVVSGSNSNLLDESPLAYKKINTVIASLQKTELARPLVRLKPLGVLKG